MNLTVEEYQTMSEKMEEKALQFMVLKRRVEELEGEVLAFKVENNLLKTENEGLKKEMALLEHKAEGLDIVNTYLRNIIYLSGGKVKEFMKHVFGVERWALLRTFLQMGIVDSKDKQQLSLIDEVMANPQEMGPSVEITSGGNQVIGMQENNYIGRDE